MGRIVGQIAKWPREPQNLSLDSGNLRHARCALRGEAGDYVIPSNPYGEISGSSKAWGEFSGVTEHGNLSPPWTHARVGSQKTGTMYGNNQADERAARKFGGQPGRILSSRSQITAASYS